MRILSFHSATGVAEKRQALIQYIWGDEGFPKKRLPDVVANVTSPVRQLDGVERVDELLIDMVPGLQGLAYHFIPTRPNGGLVVVHHGKGRRQVQILGRHDNCCFGEAQHDQKSSGMA